MTLQCVHINPVVVNRVLVIRTRCSHRQNYHLSMSFFFFQSHVGKQALFKCFRNRFGICVVNPAKLIHASYKHHRLLDCRKLETAYSTVFLTTIHITMLILTIICNTILIQRFKILLSQLTPTQLMKPDSRASQLTGQL